MCSPNSVVQFPPFLSSSHFIWCYSASHCQILVTPQVSFVSPNISLICAHHSTKKKINAYIEKLYIVQRQAGAFHTDCVLSGHTINLDPKISQPCLDEYNMSVPLAWYHSAAQTHLNRLSDLRPVRPRVVFACRRKTYDDTGLCDDESLQDLTDLKEYFAAMFVPVTAAAIDSFAVSICVAIWQKTVIHHRE